VTDDRLMLTNIIYDECLGYADKKGARATKDEVSKKIKEISPDIIEIRRVPKDSKLSKKYKIRDVNDLKILYSADKTKSVILVTMDDDFSDVKGLKAKVMKPKDYLIEDKGRKKSKIRRE
jgi:predicted nucleic acid-binding protein